MIPKCMSLLRLMMTILWTVPSLKLKTVSDINLWTTANRLKLNKSQNWPDLSLFKHSYSTYYDSRHNPQTSLPSIQFGNDSITPTEAVRNVRAIINSTLSMVPQVNSLCKTASYHLTNIGRIRHLMIYRVNWDTCTCFCLFKTDYCNVLPNGLHQYVNKKLLLVQNSAARLIACFRKYDHFTPLLIQLSWLLITQRIWFKVLLLTFKAIHKLSPVYPQELNRGLWRGGPNLISQ